MVQNSSQLPLVSAEDCQLRFIPISYSYWSIYHVSSCIHKILATGMHASAFLASEAAGASTLRYRRTSILRIGSSE